MPKNGRTVEIELLLNEHCSGCGVKFGSRVWLPPQLKDKPEVIAVNIAMAIKNLENEPCPDCASKPRNKRTTTRGLFY